MAQLTKWICDGCDRSKDTDGPDRLPVGWALICVKAQGYAPSVMAPKDRICEGAEFHLCGNCQNRHGQHIDPRRWARAADTVAQKEPANAAN